LPKFVPFIVAAVLLSALPATGFAAAHIASSDTSKVCAPDAPESYKRPGGYCDQLDDLNSLLPTGPETVCPTVADAGFRFDEIQGRVLQVGMINPCCRYGFNLEQQLPVDGILVANACPP
jgi:hypothetical protein